ncbi:MAG TPA: hypothetical protein VM536_13620 [Chloroflexia bacterium]|nr:hypothetical protein [Chloroflexia bacterium]
MKSRAAWPDRLPYRVRQFVLAAGAPVAPAEIATAISRAQLPEPAARLFRAMPRPYQRHALNVAARLYAEGHQDPPLLQAALLHDMGKWDPISGRSVGVLHRVVATLLGRVAPGRVVLARLAASSPDALGLRYGWHLQEAHPALGARLAAAAGIHPEVVAMIRYHQDPAAAPPHLAAALRCLAAADDQE